MKLKIINPAVGISDGTIAQIRKYLTPYLRSDTSLDFENIPWGFPSVETATQDIINGSETLKVVNRAQDEGYDGIFINCFDDPAVLAAREFSKIPVLGPYEPSIFLASMLAERVAVISTDQYGVISEERKGNIHRTQKHIYKIVDVGLTVLELGDDDKLLQRLYDICQELIREQVGAAVLGCTGMSHIINALMFILGQNDLKIQVVEPLRTGVTMLEYMLHTGYKNMICNATEIGAFPK